MNHKREEMYSNSLRLEDDRYTLEGQILRDIVSFCEDNRIDANTQEGLISVISYNFNRDKLMKKNRL